MLRRVSTLAKPIQELIMMSLQRCLRIAIAVSTCLSPSVSWAQAAAIYPAVEMG